MLPLARRLRWSASQRLLSSSSLAFKQSDKLRKAQLIKLWNESSYRDNSEVVRSILAEAINLRDRALTIDIADKFEALGLDSVQDKFLVIESFESSGDSARAVNAFERLSIEDGLAYIIEHCDDQISSALAKAAVDVYHLALSSNEELISNVLLGNCVLQLYERIDGLTAEEVEHAVRTMEVLKEAGGVIQIRSFEALMATANNSKLFSISETVYSEFKQAHPDSLVVSIETQRMITMLQRRQFKECLSVYDSLVRSGLPLSERMVCCAVESCIPRLYFESAIKILNKWHDQGGVMTWPICRSTMQLANAIENLAYRKNTPVLSSYTADAELPSVLEDGFLPRLDVEGSVKQVIDVYANAKEKVKTLTEKQKEQLSVLSLDSSPFAAANPFLASSAGSGSEKYDHKSEGAALTSPSTESSGAVEEGIIAAASSEGPDDASPEFKTREERLLFFRQFLVRRVIGRILQTQQSSAQYRHEPAAPEDLILMCAGQMVLQGELDTLLSILQQNEKDGKLSPIVKALFVVAPIQLMNQNQYWRESVALIERMRSFQSELPDDIQVAAITRCMLTLFKAEQMPRARHYFESLLPLFKKNASLLPLFGELIARGEVQGVVRILKVLHSKGLTLNEAVLIGVLNCCGSLKDISVVCNAWRDTNRPEFGDKSSGLAAKKLSADLMHVVSEDLCLAFARILKYARKEDQDKFVQYLGLTFSFTSEQVFLLTTGRPEPRKSAAPKGYQNHRKKKGSK